jgi:hypothetical protein
MGQVCLLRNSNFSLRKCNRYKIIMLDTARRKLDSGWHSSNGLNWEGLPPYLLLMTEADLGSDNYNINIRKTMDNIDRNLIMNNRLLSPISRIRNLFQQACAHTQACLPRAKHSPFDSLLYWYGGYAGTHCSGFGRGRYRVGPASSHAVGTRGCFGHFLVLMSSFWRFVL